MKLPTDNPNHPNRPPTLRHVSHGWRSSMSAASSTCRTAAEALKYDRMDAGSLAPRRQEGGGEVAGEGQKGMQRWAGAVGLVGGEALWTCLGPRQHLPGLQYAIGCGVPTLFTTRSAESASARTAARTRCFKTTRMDASRTRCAHGAQALTAKQCTSTQCWVPCNPCHPSLPRTPAPLHPCTPPLHAVVRVRTAARVRCSPAGRRESTPSGCRDAVARTHTVHAGCAY